MTGPSNRPAVKALRAVAAARCWALGTLGPGSAGASTLAVALATEVGGLLIEADCDGGVAGARYGGRLSEGAPSVASLLADLDAEPHVASIQNHVQRLPGGARGVLLSPAAESAVGPVRRLAEDFPRLRQQLAGETVVLDVGRVRPGSASFQIAEQADVLVAVTMPRVDTLGCLLPRLPSLAEEIPRIVVAVRGEGPYSLTEIRTSIQMASSARIPVFAIPDDPRGVAALGQSAHARRPSRPTKRGIRSAGLRRSASNLAALLTGPAPAVVSPGVAGRPVAALPLASDQAQQRRHRAVQ